MEIRNEIKGREEKKQFVQRNLADVQRAKLNKLMENPVSAIFRKNVLKFIFKNISLFTGKAGRNTRWSQER
jgi:hypothetical protein